MNIKELIQLIESNKDLELGDKVELYNLFLKENSEVFDTAYSILEESGDELDGVDLLVDTYITWVSTQDTEERLVEAFINRTMEGMTEHFHAALT